MDPQTWFGLKASEWIMVVAVFLGPIVAVWLTRYHDKRHELRTKQLNILRALLKTRQSRLDPEHVAALNLLDVEFYGDESVKAAYGKYIKHLSAPPPPEPAQDAFFEERHDLFVGLLHSLGTCLGYNFDKHDLGRRGYSPAAWGNEQERMARNAALLTELLEGKRSLPVFTVQTAFGQFPPPPNVADTSKKTSP